MEHINKPNTNLLLQTHYVKVSQSCDLNNKMKTTMRSIHKHKHNTRYKQKSININKISTCNNNNDRVIQYYNKINNQKHIPNPSSDTLYNVLSKSKTDLYSKFNPHKSRHFPCRPSA